MTVARPEPPSPSVAAAFETDGFARVEGLLDARDIEEVRALLDGLFARFGTLPPPYALDHAPQPGQSPRIPGINYALRLEPRLRSTGVFRKARSFAADLLGRPVFCIFDHAIYKPPNNQAATPWHQDHAYSGLPRVPRAVHVWIPLQDATRENGCMWFIPASHRARRVPHDRVPCTSGTLQAKIPAGSQQAVCCPVALGGVTIHGPLTLHMTGPNTTNQHRRAWILHFSRWGRLSLLHPANVIYRLNSDTRQGSTAH